MTAPSFAEVLVEIERDSKISASTVRSAFDAILAGAWTSVQVGSFATALRLRGESAEAIVAAAESMRSAMIAVDHGLPAVFDTCGTGGDSAQTLNLSSAAAIVVAACGVPVAKHGNRSISSRCGSADVFEAMGIPVDVPPAKQAEILREVGIAFLFAPAHHPALGHAAVARRELGVRTIFNALGPLANPARATHQLLGVYDDALRAIAANALSGLGVVRAWVVRGEDGLDEVSPCAPTRVSELRDGHVHERLVCPEDFGISRLERAAIAGGDCAENARAIEGILAGNVHPARDAVLLNSAAALVVATGDSPSEATSRVRRAIDEGVARDLLARWKRVAARHRP